MYDICNFSFQSAKYIKTQQLLLFLQEYSIQITFRQQWNDHRLKFDSREGKINYCGSTQVFNFSEDKRDQITSLLRL